MFKARFAEHKIIVVIKSVEAGLSVKRSARGRYLRTYVLQQEV
jgi:hypothetical protein